MCTLTEQLSLHDRTHELLELHHKVYPLGIKLLKILTSPTSLQSYISNYVSGVQPERVLIISKVDCYAKHEGVIVIVCM